MKTTCALALALLFVPPHSTAQSRSDVEMPVVLVTGVQQGPALWKVSSGDHVLWILGEISPYPRKLKWRSKEFERLLRDSQELLIDFSGYWLMDEDDASALARASRLPAGTVLRDVISPELHARLEATASRFGHPRIEELRPFAATNRLVASAMEALDLERFSVRFAAAQLAEWRGSKVTVFAVPEIAFEKRLEDWQHASNEVCLKRLVDVIEDGGSGVLRLANAWSVGDIPALRALVPQYSFSRDGFRAGDCAAAMHGGEEQARDYELRRVRSWIDEAERALKENRSTLAIVLMSELLEPDGYLAELRARGYEILEPQ
jgi:hypothetical protein